MENQSLSPEATEVRKKYFRDWRAKNKDKVKKHNQNYWERKAKQLSEATTNNLDKDDFCKIVDAVGVDKLLSKQNHYERLDRAEQELTAKEKYLKAKNRLKEIECEKQNLENIVNNYKAV